MVMMNMKSFVDGNDVTDADVVFLAWVGGVLLSDWLQKGSLEIVSPSVLRGGGLQVCGG